MHRKNKQCIDAIGDPSKTNTYKRILSILDSKDKIPSSYRSAVGVVRVKDNVGVV